MAIETGGPAFPKAALNAWGDVIEMHKGMTLRDYFAAKAMQGLAVIVDGEGWESNVAKMAYAVADAMMEARK